MKKNKIMGKYDKGILSDLLETEGIDNPQLISLFCNILGKEHKRFDSILTAPIYRKLVDECVDGMIRPFNNYLKLEGIKEYPRSRIVNALGWYSVIRSSVPRNHEHQCELVAEKTDLPVEIVEKVVAAITDDSESHPFLHDSIRQYLVAKCITEQIHDGSLSDKTFQSMFEPGVHRFIAEILNEKIDRCEEEHWDPVEVSVGPLTDYYKRLSASWDDPMNVVTGAIALDWIGRLAGVENEEVRLWVRSFLIRTLEETGIDMHRWCILFSLTRAGDMRYEDEAAHLLYDKEFAKQAGLISIVYYQDAPFRLLTDGIDLPGLRIDGYFDEFLRTLVQPGREHTIRLNAILLSSLFKKGYRISPGKDTDKPKPSELTYKKDFKSNYEQLAKASGSEIGYDEYVDLVDIEVEKCLHLAKKSMKKA